MEICLIGDFSRDLDEGYKNTSHYLAAGLARRHSVVRLNSKRVGSTAFWHDFRRARPEIIHVIAQPTTRGLMLTHLLGRLRPGARTVISALRGERYLEDRPGGQRRILRAIKPDLILAQTGETAARFAAAGCRTAQLPNGVDLQRFRPASATRKRRLRHKYGLGLDRPVVLHVGHLHRARNLQVLAPLPQMAKQVVVAGSVYMGTHRDLIEELERTGMQLLKGYQAHVEELYQLADCYVLPTAPENSISMPLSVLEAMACNLPVVTTRFPGLQQYFTQGNGFTFVDSPSEIVEHVDEAVRSAKTCATRTMICEFSWESVVERLHKHYVEIAAS